MSMSHGYNISITWLGCERLDVWPLLRRRSGELGWAQIKGVTRHAVFERAVGDGEVIMLSLGLSLKGYRRGDRGHIRRPTTGNSVKKGGIEYKDDTVSSTSINGSKIVYWHRELPPFDADAVAEHVVEATSGRVPSTLMRRDELWGRCYEDLLARAGTRLEQEVVRLAGHYAHVLDESIDSRHDEGTGEAWLHGRFTYMLYRRPAENSSQVQVSINQHT